MAVAMLNMVLAVWIRVVLKKHGKVMRARPSIPDMNSYSSSSVYVYASSPALPKRTSRFDIAQAVPASYKMQMNSQGTYSISSGRSSVECGDALR
ncbi:hypothetical protein HDU76_007893 [Blyttiomyces sp. JEL0837]|nr:hypothetical protein HDU76_007893 [Blyttiomyces sp. JEL0837]